jgi:murein DD-endopeptidase MepM/ murein hydrolase activator NlpD
MVAGVGLSLAGARARADLSSQIGAAQARQGTLQSTVDAYGARLAAIAPGLRGVEQRLAAIDADLAAKQRALAATRAQLLATRARLAQLEAQLQRDQQALAEQMRAAYEDGRPDVLTVILEARGFADLLERVDFLKRVNHENVRIVLAVRRTRTAVAREATRLGQLEVTEQRIEAAVAARRAEVGALQARLQASHDRAAAGRSHALAQLQAVSARLSSLQSQLPQASAADSGSGSSGAAPGSAGGNGFVFPLPKSAASPPSSWSLDDGVDVAAPGNTPLYAVGSGTVVLHGIGGFGPWAPVLHLDDGRYVYYGHAGPGNNVSDGTHVSAGAVVGEVGAGIVGISTGPHLEIGFADSSGSPLGPGTAPQMQSLLLGAY